MRIPTIFTEISLDASTETSIKTSNDAIEQAAISGYELELTANAAHHVANVLRMKAGDALKLFNGNGCFYHARIFSCSKKSVSVKIESIEHVQRESPLHTHLGQVMSRGDRMDFAIQKSTELGVNEITPLISERCELKLNADREHKRREHWQQVAISAAEQCGRATVPIIHPVSTLQDWIDKHASQGLSLVFHHRDTQTLTAIQNRPELVNLLIGPEGGLSESEIELARNAGFIACTFGPRVMRTETAPVACLSVLQWLWGDFQDKHGKSK